MARFIALGGCVLAAFHAFVPVLAQADPSAGPQVRVVQSDPGLAGRLGDGEALYVRLAYASGVPLRFRAEGYAAGHNVSDGAMYNPAPAYPSGEGEALVWIAYRGAATIDTIRITVLDENWRPLSVLDLRASLEWTRGGAGAARPLPAWVQRLSGEQQAAAARLSVEAQDEEGAAGAWILAALWLSVGGYFALQAVSLLRFGSGWRLAASMPLVVTVPLLVYTLAALLFGSNLWPLALLVVAPVAFVYLLAVSGLRFAVRAGHPG